MTSVVAQGAPDPAASAIFVRSCHSKVEIARRGGFTVLFQRGSYNHLQEKIFLLDEKIDCFAWNGMLFILDVLRFERMFNHYDQLRSQAESTVARIADRVPIHNLAEFRSACTTDVRFMRKLAIIAQKPYLEEITLHDVERTISEFELGIDVKEVRRHEGTGVRLEPGDAVGHSEASRRRRSRFGHDRGKIRSQLEDATCRLSFRGLLGCGYRGISFTRHLEAREGNASRRYSGRTRPV